MNLRVRGEQPDGYDVDFEMQDGSVRQILVPREWLEEEKDPGGHVYLNLDDGCEHDLSEQPTLIRSDLEDVMIDESPTIIDRARGRRREALVARVLSMQRRG